MLKINCVICGKERKVRRAGALYCGNTCKAIGWAEKKKAKILNRRFKKTKQGV